MDREHSARPNTPHSMNLKRCTVILILGLSAESAAQEARPSATVSAFLAEMRKDGEKQQNLRDLAAASDKAVAALRADLAGPWTSVVIALRHVNSLRDTSFRGFRISRAGEPLKVTVAAWYEMSATEQTGEAHPITKHEVERLFSETVLYFLAASLLEAPIEKAGPRPADQDKVKEWLRSYRAAGGIAVNRLAETDDYGIDVRIATPSGLKQYGSMWGNHCPGDFLRWITLHDTDSAMKLSNADPSGVPDTFIKNVNVKLGARESQPFPWKSDLTMLDVVKAAIGHQPVMASIKSVRLVRDSERTTIDFRKLRDGDVSNPVLRPGDTIEIPD